MFIIISRIEMMDSIVWELRGEEKRVCLLCFSLQGEKDRNDEFVCMGVAWRRE